MISISDVLTKFHGKPSNWHTLLIHLKRRDSLEKRVPVFVFHRFINMSRLHRGMCQLEMPPANDITELLSFTVILCKLELHAKAIVSESRSKQDFALYLDEIPRFSSIFGPDFVLLLIQGIFFVLEHFMTMKRFGFKSVTTVECKQKNMDHDTMVIY